MNDFEERLLVLWDKFLSDGDYHVEHFINPSNPDLIDFMTWVERKEW